MPRRKSDAAEGESQKAAPDATAADAGAEAAEPSREPIAPEEGAERSQEIATPDEASEPSRELATPDEAAEPGAPDAAGPPPEAADPVEAIEPYREPEIVTPQQVAAEERAAADEAVRPSAPEIHEEVHEPEEEGGSSLASKLLLGLVLLLVGAGLALWAAPKLARHLPSGMSGVAEWLTPGVHDAEARIAELEARLDERVGGVESRLTGLASADDVDARVGAAIDAATTRLDGEIAAVKQSVEQLGSSELPQQVARLQSSLEGQSAELATLKDQLSGTAAASGQLSDDAVAKIDVYRAELDGLRAEVGTLQDRVAGFSTQVEQAVQNAEREIESARTQAEAARSEADTRLSVAEADTNLALIRAAIESGAPFQAPLEALEGHAGVSVPQGLVAAAPTGVATMAQLRDQFSDAAHSAIRSSIMAGAGDGVVDRTRAFFGAQMASRSLTPQQGMSPDAVLSRVEDKLRQDDLDAALAEAGQLPSEAQAAMEPWLAAARLRAGAADGLAELDAALTATH